MNIKILATVVVMAVAGSGCLDPIVGIDCEDEGATYPDCTPAPAAEVPGSCEGSECLDEQPVGHVVLIGHDYGGEQPDVIAQRILGNAVLMARRPTVNVAVYEGTAPTTARDGVRVAIDVATTEVGRFWDLTVVGEGPDGSLALDGQDVLLIHSQPTHPGGDRGLEDLGTTWKNSINAFLNSGGIVVGLDGPSAHGGTVQVLAAAGVVPYENCVSADGEAMFVADRTDAVTIGVPREYAASNSVRFAGAGEGAVVTDGVGAVVVHVAH